MNIYQIIIIFLVGVVLGHIVTANWVILIHAIRLAYGAFQALGLGGFMLIFGALTIVMLWVFDRW